MLGSGWSHASHPTVSTELVSIILKIFKFNIKFNIICSSILIWSVQDAIEFLLRLFSVSINLVANCPLLESQIEGTPWFNLDQMIFPLDKDWVRTLEISA